MRRITYSVTFTGLLEVPDHVDLVQRRKNLLNKLEEWSRERADDKVLTPKDFFCTSNEVEVTILPE